MTVELGILGDLVVTRAGHVVVLPRGMSQQLLLSLAVGRDRPLSDHELIDRLWGSTPPPNAMASLRNTVSRVRTLLGADVIHRHTAGYQLNRTASRLDVDQFDQLVDNARQRLAADDPEGALAALDRALRLVRGRPLAQVADQWWARAAAGELTERIALAEELWAEIRLRSDRAGRELGRMHQAARNEPQRELRWRQVMQGLAAAGRRTEALRVADEAKRALAEFGLTPGPEIVALEVELLGAPGDITQPMPMINRLATMGAEPFVGRGQLLSEVADTRGVVWLDGEPGIGKTRVLAEVAVRSTDRGHAVLYGACERSAAAGNQLIVDIATAALQASPAPPWMPVELAALLGHEAPAGANAHLDAGVRRARIRSGLLGLLTTLANERPVVVLADDVHWIDDETADIVLHLVERTPPSVRWIFASRHRSERSASIHLRSELIRRQTMFAYWLEPLEVDDLRELVHLMAPDSDDATRASIVDQVVGPSAGNALLATELIAHRLARPHDTTTPPRLDAIVASMLDVLTDDERELLTTLAVAGPRCPPRLLADAMGASMNDTLAMAERIVMTGLLAPVTPSVIDFRHDVLAGVVRNGLELSAERAARQRLIDAAARDDRHVVALAEHLLEMGDLLTDARIEQRRVAVGAAVEQLARQIDYERAAAVGRRYLAVSARDTTSSSLAAKLRIATALIAGGHVAEGSSLLEALTHDVRSTGDPILRADLALARGPLQTGGLHGNELAAEAEQILSQLPTTDVTRWVQLACWAAHHRLNEGDRTRALDLLADADRLQFPPSLPYLHGLVLAIRAQADLTSVAGPGPVAAHESLTALHAFAQQTDDETAIAADSLFRLGAAFKFGTAASVASARVAVERSAQQLPRSDLRWWPLVSQAAVLLSTGDLSDASDAIDRAMKAGGDEGVEMAVRTGLMQRALHMLLSGQLGSLAGMLRPQAMAPDASTAVISIYGLACVQADDLAAARGAAERLRTRLPLLATAGIAWPNVAMAASEVAHFTCDGVLAASLWDELHRWSGTGLSVMGAAYFGTVDGALGRLALAMGRTDEARAYLTSARQQETVRGWTAWRTRVDRVLQSVALP